jgi:hypothetical protein
MFVATGRKQTKYKLVKGDQLNPDNDKFPDRFLLLKHIADDKFEVVDFPDIRKYDEEKAFYTYKMNPAGLGYFTGVVSDLKAKENNWK